MPGLSVGLVPAHGPGYVAEMLEHATLAQEFGFDSLWIEEHHEAGAYWPTPFVALGILAACTTAITLGTDVLVLPLHDPVSIAEHAAVLDVMTGGRFILGVAIGDDAREFGMFRVPARRRGAMFEEQVQIIRALWSGEPVAHRGAFYTLEATQLSVRPMRAGGPPIWVGGWGPLQLRRAAMLGDAWLPGPVADIEAIVARQRQYVSELRDTGRLEARQRPLTRDVVVASTRAEAWQIARDQVFPEYYRSYVESDHPLVGGEQARYATLDDVARGRMVIGDPEDVTRELLDCVTRTGCDHLIIRLKLPGVTPALMGAMIHLLGQHVLPNIRASA